MQPQSMQMTGSRVGGSFSSLKASLDQMGSTARTTATNLMLFGEKQWGATELLQHVGATMFEMHLIGRLKETLNDVLSEEPRKNYPEVVGEITLLRFLRWVYFFFFFFLDTFSSPLL